MNIFAEIPSSLSDLGVACGIFAAVIAALKSPPGRMIWRRLIAAPLSEWVDTLIGPRLNKIEQSLNDHMVEEIELLEVDLIKKERVLALEGERNRIIDRRFEESDEMAERRFARVEEHQIVINDRVAAALEALGVDDPWKSKRTKRDGRHP